MNRHDFYTLHCPTSPQEPSFTRSNSSYLEHLRPGLWEKEMVVLPALQAARFQPCQTTTSLINPTQSASNTTSSLDNTSETKNKVCWQRQDKKVTGGFDQRACSSFNRWSFDIDELEDNFAFATKSLALEASQPGIEEFSVKECKYRGLK